jgi:hypothetical protein
MAKLLDRLAGNRAFRHFLAFLVGAFIGRAPRDVWRVACGASLRLRRGASVQAAGVVIAARAHRARGARAQAWWSPSQ